jgi:hypothetical protein
MLLSRDAGGTDAARTLTRGHPTMNPDLRRRTDDLTARLAHLRDSL